MASRSKLVSALVLASSLAPATSCVYDRTTRWSERPAAAATAADPRVWEPGERRVFTIFAHGTGGHRNGRDGELISELGAAYWGRGERDDPNDAYRRAYQRRFLILDGVGATSATVDAAGEDPIGVATARFPEHPTPGDFWPDTLDKALKPPDQRVSNMVLKKTAWTAHRGDLMGDGWDDNVAHALFVLGRLADAGEFPEVINVVGWSRGAVTSIKLANAICDWFVDGRPYRVPRDYMRGYAPDNMEVLYPPRSTRLADDAFVVHLFLVDPVPGRFGGDGSTFGSDRATERFPPDEVDYRRFPRVVRDAVIVLANDEQREGFAALDADDVRIEDPTRTRAVWLPMPGVHRTPVYLVPRDPKDGYDDPPVRRFLTAVPRLTWDLALRFLLGRGTAFEVDLFERESRLGGGPMGPDEVADRYADVWLRKESYHQGRNRGTGSRVLGGLISRIYTGYPFAGREYSWFNPIQLDRARADLFTAQLGVYVRHPGFFVNEHHRACYAAAWPALYRHLTVDGVPGRPPAPVERELRDLVRHPAAWTQLAALGVARDGEEFRFRSGFRFGDRLGEPLRHDASPEPARFTGVVAAMGLVDRPQPPE